MSKGFELQFQIPTHHFWEIKAGSQAAEHITPTVNSKGKITHHCPLLLEAACLPSDSSGPSP